jgi:hypothetical protein
MIDRKLLITQWPDSYASLYEKAIAWIEARYIKGSLLVIPENLKGPKAELENQLNEIWLEDKGIEMFRKTLRQWCKLWLQIESASSDKTAHVVINNLVQDECR